MARKKSQKPHQLSKKELRKRARNIKLVLADSDGVLTDTGVYFTEMGEMMKRYSIRDGIGTQRLREVGIETGYISAEVSPSLKKRAEILRLHHVYLGIDDKRATLQGILSSVNIRMSEVAYIGDDVNDLEAIMEIGLEGLTSAPADGLPTVKRAVHHICKAKGGHGAFRDFAEWIIGLRIEH